MPGLAERQCVPCRGGTAPLTASEIAPLIEQIVDWTVVDGHHLIKVYKLRNFAEALNLVNRIAQIAEEQNHHPDLVLAWGRVEVTIWTHKINGLAEGDFVFAAKCDRVAATNLQ